MTDPYDLLALYTGLRRSEIEKLQWGDLELSEKGAQVRLRALATKNRRGGRLPLRRDLVEMLKARKKPGAENGDLVFSMGLPRMRVMRKDFEAAGIRREDSEGRLADFHSLRKTFDTYLQRNGAGMAVTMELMRHSDARQTMGTYLDETLLEKEAAIARLPDFGLGTEGTEKGTNFRVGSGPHVSQRVERQEEWREEEWPGKRGESFEPRRVLSPTVH